MVPYLPQSNTPFWCLVGGDVKKEVEPANAVAEEAKEAAKAPAEASKATEEGGATGGPVKREEDFFLNAPESNTWSDDESGGSVLAFTPSPVHEAGEDEPELTDDEIKAIALKVLKNFTRVKVDWRKEYNHLSKQQFGQTLVQIGATQDKNKK